MKKIDIKAGVSWLVYILYNKVFLKVSLSIYYPIAIFKPLLGKISLEFSWITGWCLGKNIFDFSGSDFVIGNFFLTFFGSHFVDFVSFLVEIYQMIFIGVDKNYVQRKI